MPLVALAEEVAERYFREFPDDLEGYSAEVRDWAVHDTQYILAWALAELGGTPILLDRAEWLGRVLAGRGFPLERLARNLELTAGVLAARAPEHAAALERMLGEAAAAVRAL